MIIALTNWFWAGIPVLVCLLAAVPASAQETRGNINGGMRFYFSAYAPRR